MYTKEETYRILNLEDTVTVVPAGGKFYDWDKEFDVIYKCPKSGSITKNHCFSFEYNNVEDVLLTSKVAYKAATTTTQKMMKIKKGWSIIDRQYYLFNISPTPLVEPGLSEQKQIHLYCKWRPLLPIEAQDITCPKPTEDVIQRCKNIVKEKKS